MRAECEVMTALHTLRGGPSRPCDLYLERVVEAIEVVEQTNDADEFDELAFIVMRGDGVPHLIGDMTIAASDCVGQLKRSSFGWLEVCIPSLWHL
jgi:hypothetical protein